MPSQMEEKQVTQEDVKQALEKNLEELGGTPKVPSAKEKPTGSPTAEVVKSDKPEVKEVKEEGPVPYERFKEVNDKIKELEEYRELYEQNKQYVRRNPDTGKMEVYIPDEKPVVEEDPLKRFDLTDEEKLFVSPEALTVYEKIAQRELFKQQQQHAQFTALLSEKQKFWNQAQEDFPDVKDPKGELFQRAQKLLKEEFGQKLPTGQTVWLPRAQYDAVLKAYVQLEREKKSKATETAIAKKEEIKNQKSQVLVEKKSQTSQESVKKKLTQKEMEGMTKEERAKSLEEAYYELHPDERPQEE